MNIAIQGGLDPLQARTITKEKIPDTSFSSNLQCIYKKSDRMMQYLLFFTIYLNREQKQL